MADVSAPTPIFLRGSAVLDYWLVHAEGLTIQPLGARVEEVVTAAPVGHAETLIVRSGMTRRRTAIPAASIVAVEPSAGKLLMEAQPEAEPRRLWAERLVAARVNVSRGRRFARAHAGGALRRTRAGSVAALSWSRTRAVQLIRTSAQHVQRAAARTARGLVWLARRLLAGARTIGANAALLTLTAVTMIARGVARTARELRHVTALGVERGRASLEARRARRTTEPTEEND